MTATQKIKRSLASVSEGEVFDYGRFAVSEGQEYALTKALSRLSKSGEIVRLEKGKYYKPRQTKFGAVRPPEPQVVKALSVKNDRPIGYLTGTALYNSLGLTTQVSNVLEIARNTRLPEKDLLGYKIRFVVKPFTFREQDIPLLQLLDALQDIKKIPDTSAERSIPVLQDRMKKLTAEELNRMAKLALSYNPATKALLGALLEQLFPSVPVTALKKSLTPLSKYKLNIPETVLPNRSNWNIE
jgi:hypothetical protein